MRWFRHVRTPPEHQKSIFRHSAIQFKQHGTAVFVTLLLTQLRCRIQNDCYKLPRCLKTLCFCWSWGGRERKRKSCWMKTYVCGTVLGDRALWWHIAMEQSIFRYLRGWELHAFCVELRAYKMQECHTASFLPACAWFAFPRELLQCYSQFQFWTHGASTLPQGRSVFKVLLFMFCLSLYCTGDVDNGVILKNENS